MVGFSDLLWDPQASKKTARSSTPSPAEKASQVPQNQKPLPQKHLNALAVSDKLAHVLPCTASSHATGNFFDLQPLIRQYPHDRYVTLSLFYYRWSFANLWVWNSADWQVRGIDFHANFTINFCAPLLLPVEFDDQGKEVAPSHDEPVKPAIESLDQYVLSSFLDLDWMGVLGEGHFWTGYHMHKENAVLFLKNGRPSGRVWRHYREDCQSQSCKSTYTQYCRLIPFFFYQNAHTSNQEDLGRGCWPLIDMINILKPPFPPW